MADLVFEPVEPEADARFSYIRLMTPEEQALHEVQHKPVTFLCVICCQETPVFEPPAFSWRAIRASPMPGNICTACCDRHSQGFDFNVGWRKQNGRTFRALRSLSAITHALKEEADHAHRSR